jgi:hypothetical protein
MKPIVDNEGSKSAFVRDIRMEYSWPGCTNSAKAEIITNSDTIELVSVGWKRITCNRIISFHRIQQANDLQLLCDSARFVRITIKDTSRIYRIDDQILSKTLKKIYQY